MPKANGLRTNPIVYDGIMYVTNSNEVRALDARTGQLVWEYKDTRSKKEAVNRGAAILGDQVFFVTGDVHLVSLDRRNGSVLWQKQYGRMEDGLFATSAPLVVKDKVIVGVAGGDSGMRGYLCAFSAEDGRRVVATLHRARERRARIGDMGRVCGVGRRRDVAQRHVRS